MKIRKTIFEWVKVPLKYSLRMFFGKEYLNSVYFNDYRGYLWSIRAIVSRNILRLNSPLPFPCHHSVTITNWRNLDFNFNDINNFQSPGCYFQCSAAKITIGKGCFIAPNVAIITANHSFSNLADHEQGRAVVIGENSWIGFGCVILPGVFLAPGTVVGANSLVTKSVHAESMLICGNPASSIRSIR
jgi:acetyltransferase-like isoleucine patch superfamily enzyme